MVWATARSVREERSRQRYALQDFSLIRVSLIKGKSGWRIGSTEALGNPFLDARGRLARGGITYLIKMLRRYVQGEQSMSTAFDDLAAALLAIRESDDVFAITAWQNVVVTRLLYTLGYVALRPSIELLVTTEDVTDAVLVYEPALEGEIERLILHASTMSHL
jgi:recombinational DNA repair protein (RecF pathway)